MRQPAWRDRVETAPAHVLERERCRMVDEQLVARGIVDPLVLAAMRTVPRERFVPSHLVHAAYDDAPVPIGEEQTISQPYIVARMAEAARLGPTDRVLEIGTGSGYAAAVMAEITAEVYTVERLAVLVERARRCLEGLGYTTVHVRHGDGTLGWSEHAPYDAIVVTAGGPRVPAALLDQLALRGRLVMPVGVFHAMQYLVRVVREAAADYRYEQLEGVAFVPLIGVDGWPETEARR
jgi:protein-L-isoaspartate(D-aspartate) O-methyltransferase